MSNLGFSGDPSLLNLISDEVPYPKACNDTVIIRVIPCEK